MEKEKKKDEKNKFCKNFSPNGLSKIFNFSHKCPQNAKKVEKNKQVREKVALEVKKFFSQILIFFFLSK